MAEPLREELWCPRCKRQHLDSRWYVYHDHATHHCLFHDCRHIWTEDHASVGVRLSPAQGRLLPHEPQEPS